MPRVRELATVFAALADTTRLEMLALLLAHGELCVCDFVGALGISQSKASRLLRYLWHSGLLADRRAGLWVYYRLSPELGADGKAIVGALRRLFDSRDLSGTDKRLQAWLSNKRRAGTCKTVPRPARRK